MQNLGEWQFDLKKDFLGAGSFGKVYKARNAKNEIVALKSKYCLILVLDMKLFHDRFMIESLKTEISVMKQLKSPNVVRMYDVFENSSKTSTYMVIELCDGDLRSLMQKKGYLEQALALEVMRQLMEGFHDLVNHNYIHRDIKPENCLFKGNIYKVADFGFATKVDITGRQLLSECVGTPLYMSPQILNHQQYNAKSDIWSIGMMFYEMLFGKCPWSCRDMNSLLKNIKTQSVKFPYERPVSQEIKNFILRCLQIDESKRIGWQEIFTSQIFLKKHDEQQNQIKLNDRCIKILRKLQSVVQQNNLDPQYIFMKFDKDKNNQLDFKEFSQLILAIDQSTTPDNVQLLFQRIGHQNGVNFSEFQKLFTEYDFSDLSDRAGNIVKDIQEVIKNNKINISEIFKKYDIGRDGSLTYDEFTSMIKVIVPGLKDYEIRLIFQKFDRDASGTISFAEFQYILTKGTGNTQRDALSQRAAVVLNKLQTTVKTNNLNTKKIFQNFDKSGDLYLDISEFQLMLRAIDQTISKTDAAQIFHIVDRNNDEQISYDEFKLIFN